MATLLTYRYVLMEISSMKTVSYFEPGTVNFFVVGGQLFGFDHQYKDIRPLDELSQFQHAGKRSLIAAANNDLTGRSDGWWVFSPSTLAWRRQDIPADLMLLISAHA